MIRMIIVMMMICCVYSCSDDKKDTCEAIALVNKDKGHVLDSITFLYCKENNDTWRIKKTFYIQEKRKQFDYLIKMKDSICFIGKEAIVDGEISKNIEFKKYLSLKDTVSSYFTCGLFFDANGHMKYLGTENVVINKKMVRLYKFIGQDIGLKSDADNTYFFDRNFVLRKVVMSSRGVLE